LNHFMDFAINLKIHLGYDMNSGDCMKITKDLYWEWLLNLSDF